MKLFKITFNKASYDEYIGFIIRAKDRKEAIAIAKNETEKRDHLGAWAYSNAQWHEGYKLKEITIEGKAGIILDSFNAG